MAGAIRRSPRRNQTLVWENLKELKSAILWVKLATLGNQDDGRFKKILRDHNKIMFAWKSKHVLILKRRAHRAKNDLRAAAIAGAPPVTSKGSGCSREFDVNGGRGCSNLGQTVQLVDFVKIAQETTRVEVADLTLQYLAVLVDEDCRRHALYLVLHGELPGAAIGLRDVGLEADEVRSRLDNRGGGERRAEHLATRARR